MTRSSSRRTSERWRAPFLRAVQTVQDHVRPARSPLRHAAAGPTAAGAGPPEPGGGRVAPPGSRPAAVRVGGASAGCPPPDWPGRSPSAVSCRRCPSWPTTRCAGPPTASTASRTARCSTSGAPRRGRSGSTVLAMRARRRARRGRAPTGRRPYRLVGAERPPRRAAPPRRLRLGQRGPGGREHGGRAGRGDLVRDGRPGRHGVPDVAGHPRLHRRLRGGGRVPPHRRAVARRGRGGGVGPGLHGALRARPRGEGDGPARPARRATTGWPRPAKRCSPSSRVRRWAGRPGGPRPRPRRRPPRGRRGSRPSARRGRRRAACGRGCRSGSRGR